MALRRELFVMIGTLVVLNLILAFGTIGLLVRMGPAIDRIFQENVYSMVAGDEMLAELATAGGEPLSPEARKRVREALARAERNVTEAEEAPVLDSLARRLQGAEAGDAAARRGAIEDLGALVRINREAMRRVDVEAQRLGRAGAWAAVYIGLGSFLLSILVVIRLQRRFVRPLVDLHDVLASVRQGNRLRRCLHLDAPHEVIQVTEAVNQLLDERLKRA